MVAPQLVPSWQTPSEGRGDMSGNAEESQTVVSGQGMNTRGRGV